MRATASRVAALVALAVGMLALPGALPGEMRGCDTDLSDEVDHVVYCRDRCAVVCERVVTCGRYTSTAEPPDGGTILDLCQAECEQEYGCRNPFLCPNEDRYISEREAETCLSAWGDLPCSEFDGVATCGEEFASCPRPNECRGDVLCDGPEWE